MSNPRTVTTRTFTILDVPVDCFELDDGRRIMRVEATHKLLSEALRRNVTKTQMAEAMAPALAWLKRREQ